MQDLIENVELLNLRTSSSTTPTLHNSDLNISDPSNFRHVQHIGKDEKKEKYAKCGYFYPSFFFSFFSFFLFFDLFFFRLNKKRFSIIADSRQTADPKSPKKGDLVIERAEGITVVDSTTIKKKTDNKTVEKTEKVEKTDHDNGKKSHVSVKLVKLVI